MPALTFQRPPERLRVGRVLQADALHVRNQLNFHGFRMPEAMGHHEECSVT